MTFAVELADRFIAHPDFVRDFEALQGEAALSTLAGDITPETLPLTTDAVHRLLYCAGVFVQTEREPMRALAQSIALGCLLARGEDVAPENALRLLTDLGNFPALAYAEARHADDGVGLAQSLRAALCRDLNAFQVGSERLSLTDFQKLAWARLKDTTALAISAPTSAGKSFLVIEHLCRLAESEDAFVAVYVAPTRALLSEIHSTIQARLQDTDVRVSTVPSPSDAPRQIFILTQERLQVLLAIADLTFNLVVVDEAQNFSDGARGMILQETLDQVFSRDPGTRIVMLAPGAEGFAELGRSIGLPDLRSAESRLPSVVQNRILVSPGRQANTLALRLMSDTQSTRLGVIEAKRGFHLSSPLVAIALELGRVGGSLVYATGPKDAVAVAGGLHNGLKDLDDPMLEALAKFIADHVHPEYGLVQLVKRGVAFHYGKMPTLLRETLEAAFKSGDLRYLACTTTLFQGVNLPARNVFIDTATRGKGVALDAAELWNFAGRAGRMKADIVGNVFLVNYELWPDRPMDQFVSYRIEPAFRSTAETLGPELIEALGGEMPRPKLSDERPNRIRAAAGLLISRAARGDVRKFLERTLPASEPEKRDALAAAAEAAHAQLELPAALLATNWTVDPFGLKRLYDYLVSQIKAGEADAMIPVSPLIDPTNAKDRYYHLFTRIETRVNLGFGPSPAKTAMPAVMWMAGKPYPVLLSSAINAARRAHRAKLKEHEAYRAANPLSRRKAPPPPDVNDVIHDTFGLIEDTLRFRYVQLGKAYQDVLVLALAQCGLQDRAAEIFDFALALELGVSSKSSWSFMELGLSRLAAVALEPHLPDSNMSAADARVWLRGADLGSLKLSQLVLEELERLGLVAAADVTLLGFGLDDRDTDDEPPVLA
ncbi:DEAD/DEAH box helicase [Brevundimonas sp.]|uniref:DEAD/DEAH box helicase n=1 Tax=Brevundimonas sp. TaxID=1871086 RepID=UPI0028A29B65|nr:DEAD/DEAH box helicase [Brevundimonas sp.]